MAEQLQTKEQFDEINDQRLTAIAIRNPSIALLQVNSHITLAISRDTIVEHQVTCLRAAMLVKIPLGWRLSLLRLRAWLGLSAALDETEFDELRIDATKSPGIALADHDYVCDVDDTSFIFPISRLEYLSLMQFSGRQLLRWVEHFGIGAGHQAVTPRRQKPRSAA